MTQAGDIFGALVVEAIMSTGLNAKTARAVSDRVLEMLRGDAGPDELLRVFANYEKIYSSVIAWRAREDLHRSYVEAADKVQNLDAIRGIGRVSAEHLARAIEKRLAQQS